MREPVILCSHFYAKVVATMCIMAYVINIGASGIFCIFSMVLPSTCQLRIKSLSLKQHTKQKNLGKNLKTTSIFTEIEWSTSKPLVYLIIYQKADFSYLLTHKHTQTHTPSQAKPSQAKPTGREKMWSLAKNLLCYSVCGADHTK